MIIEVKHHSNNKTGNISKNNALTFSRLSYGIYSMTSENVVRPDMFTSNTLNRDFTQSDVMSDSAVPVFSVLTSII